MTWRVELSPRAMRDLAGLARGLQAKILKKLEDASREPPRFFRKLAGDAGFRLRVGDDRVLADLDPRTKTIRVHHVGHRKTVYD